MALNSILTNTAAMFAQSNIGKANSKVSLMTARLSSGSRIVRAADDVAALSAGTSLRTNVTTLKRALINTAQGSSLLQVADGALTQVTDILQRQKAIAVQATSGTLTSDERSFLDEEFQQLAGEIDRLVGNTNFNGVNLLDGSLSDTNYAQTNTNNATAAELTITLTTNVAAGNVLVLNGVTITEGTDWSRDASSLTASIDSLVNFLNSSTNTALSQAEYSRSGNTLVATVRAGGTLGESFVVDANNSTGTFGTAGYGGEVLSSTNLYAAQGASNEGLSLASVSATGTIGDNIITAQNQSSAEVRIAFQNLTELAAGDTLQLEDGEGGTITFTLVTSGAAASATNIVTYGTASSTATTLEERIDAIVGHLNTYDVNDDYGIKQLEFSRDGEDLVMTYKGSGNVQNGTTGANYGATLTIAAIATGLTGGTISGSFVNGGTSGINTDGVTNKDFIGAISGFNAEFSSTDNVDVSVTVGEHTYTAQGVSTTPTANTTVRFFSDTGGGYFDIQMGANNGTNVLDQGDADVFAARLDKAFSGLTFYQEQNVTNYDAAGDIVVNGSTVGSLTGTSISISQDDFTDVTLDDVSISAPLDGTTDGIIEFTINGEVYRSAAGITDELGPNQTYRFTSLSNASEYVDFTTGGTAIQFSNSDEAAAFETALKDALGFGEGGVSLSFQVGVTSTDTLAISISNIGTDTIYQGQDLNVLTADAASYAADALDYAIDRITEVRASVGALQSRFDFASANIESSLQNQDAARGVLLDTDIASESTNYAQTQVQLQAGIAVLAQANLLPQQMLKLIG